MNQKLVRFYNIKWDASGHDKANLPKQAKLSVDADLDIDTEGADELSDKFGYCVFGFDYEVLDSGKHRQRSSYEDITKKLGELLDKEHGGCDDTTCAMSHCMKHGYYLWAIELFARSGASSDEFNDLYSKLPRKKFDKEAEIERSEFVENVPSAACPHCNAVVYEPDECGHYCSNCGEKAVFEVLARCSLPDGVAEGATEKYVEGFRVLRVKELSENETLFEVAMEYGKSPSELTKEIIESSIGSEMPRGTKITVLSGLFSKKGA